MEQEGAKFSMLIASRRACIDRSALFVFSVSSACGLSCQCNTEGYGFSFYELVVDNGRVRFWGGVPNLDRD